MSDIDEIIETGLVFRAAPKAQSDNNKVKTKAKKKKYITGFSNAVAVDGRDYRQPTQRYPNTDDYHFFGRYPTDGRPTASIIDEYFYIPHKGWYTVGHTQDGHYFAELKYLGENIDNR